MDLLLLFFFLNTSEARVFNFSDESFATYFRGSMGLASIKQDAYSGVSGGSTVFSEAGKHDYSGEFGVFFASEQMALSLGIELVAPEKININGANSLGVELLSLESKVNSTALRIGLFYFIPLSQTSRFYFEGGMGYAQLNLKNNYDLNANGQLEYGFSTYQLLADSTSYYSDFRFGYERLMADTATFHIDFGYRYFDVREWKYKDAGSGFVNHSKGDIVLNNNNEKLSTNLSSFFIGIGIRLYIK